MTDVGSSLSPKLPDISQLSGTAPLHSPNSSHGKSSHTFGDKVLLFSSNASTVTVYAETLKFLSNSPNVLQLSKEDCIDFSQNLLLLYYILSFNLFSIF